MSEVDEKLVERVAAAIADWLGGMFPNPAARAAIAAMREAGWRPLEGEIAKTVFERQREAIERLQAERDREKARADRLQDLLTAAVRENCTHMDAEARERARAEQAEAYGNQQRARVELLENKLQYAESALKERDNTIACQDRRYGYLELELRKQSKRAERAEEALTELRQHCAQELQVRSGIQIENARLERELRELREQRAPITVPLELTGNVAAEWAKMQERLATLEQASQERCQDINEHELRLAKLERAPSAMSEEKRARLSAAGWKVGTVEEFMDDAFPRQSTADASSDAAVGMLTEKLNAHRYQPFTAYMVQRLLAGVGLHVWSGDVEGLKSEIRSMKIAYPYNLSLDKILRKYGLIRATAGAAGEGE